MFFLLMLMIYAAWAGFRFYSARRQGLPAPPPRSYIPFMGGNQNTNYPTPRSSGPLDWVRDKLASLRRNRTSRGAYEEAGGAEHGLTSGRRGRGLEDDAWDAQVGTDDPYETGRAARYDTNDEAGVAPPPDYSSQPYGPSDYQSRDTEYTAGGDRGRNLGTKNPFGDENQAPSLRSVSPRPEIDTSKAHKKDNASVGSAESSPTSVRKSAFQERI